MTDALEPTEEGKLRYRAYVDTEADPPQEYAAGYNHAFAPAIPCTCTQACQSRCAGECGCEACKMVFAEYANMSGWFRSKSDPQDLTLEQQLEEFRGALGPARRS